MELDWDFSLPPPTDEELNEFERLYGVRIIDEHRWFLKNIVNGGFLKQSYIIPTTDCPGGAASWQAAYGISHPNLSYDLGQAIKNEKEWALEFNKQSLARYVPLGSDSIGGQVLIDISVNIGQVVYNSRDPFGYTYSADSIHHFLETLIPDDEV